MDAHGLNDECHKRKARREFNEYLRDIPKPKQLLEWAEQQRSFDSPVLIVWDRDDKLTRTARADRLAEQFDNAQLVWVDDSRTLIPLDQPRILTDHLRTFLAAHT